MDIYIIAVCAKIPASDYPNVPVGSMTTMKRPPSKVARTTSDLTTKSASIYSPTTFVDNMLGSLEKEVVSALKAVGKAPTRVILKEMRKRNVDVAYTTVSTILTRLHKKGLVKRTKGSYKGRVRYTYSYMDIEEEYIDGMIAGLVKVFGEKGLVHLSTRIDELSDEELGEMRKRLKI